jgi:hypothetical protein
MSKIGQCKFLDYAAEALDDSAFGLHHAGQIDPRDGGMYFYGGSAARDLGEALALFSRYCRIVNEAFHLTQRSGDTAVEFEYVGLPRYAARHNMEYVVAAIAAAFERCQAATSPRRKSRSRKRNSDVREFERFFGCPVEFGAPTTVFQISADALSLPLITADPKLLRVLRPYCDAAAGSGVRNRERCAPRLRPRWRSCCPTAKRKPKVWQEFCLSVCAPSRQDWPMKAQHTAKSSTNCGRAWRLNI